MGKNLIQQRRGKGSSVFKRPRSTSKQKVFLKSAKSYTINGFIRSTSHTAPLAVVVYDDKTIGTVLATTGTTVGQTFEVGSGAPLKIGNSIPLKEIPEGTSIFNIEVSPGDGGKLVRASGMSATIVLRGPDKVVVKLPSKKQKSFNPDCKAMIGDAAGGGRTEKPFLKAGFKFHRMKARHTYWPIVSGGAMNAVAHPMGNKRSSRKSKARPAPKNAPPGRNVGMIRPRRTGRKK
ncbi:MAG: 50S ribosomal protein L2 [Candidatus Woesearchaeota archaeon]